MFNINSRYGLLFEIYNFILRKQRNTYIRDDTNSFQFHSFLGAQKMQENNNVSIQRIFDV